MINNIRYKEKYEEGSELLWPSEKEDKITRQFYKDLSYLSRNLVHQENQRINLIQQIILIITDRGASTKALNKKQKK